MSVRLIERAHGADAVIHLEFVADWAIDYGRGDERVRRAEQRRNSRRRNRQDGGEIIWNRASHHGVYGDLLDRVRPRRKGALSRRHLADDLVRLVARGLQHRSHLFLGGNCDGHEVRHAIVEEILLQIVGRVGERGRAGRRSDRACFQFVRRERPRQRVDDFLHQWLAADRIVPIEVGVHLLVRLAPHRMRREADALERHSSFCAVG